MNKALKWTLILLPVFAGGYIIYRQVKRYQASKAPANGLLPASTNTGMSCIFPLQKGSTGPCVKQLQLALIGKYGASILPKYGADSSWGTETDGAVKGLTGSVVIKSKADYDAIIQSLQN